MRRALVVACALWLLACEQEPIEIEPLDGGADGGGADATVSDATVSDAAVADATAANAFDDAGPPRPPLDGGSDGDGGDDDGGVAWPLPDAVAAGCIGFDNAGTPIDVAALRDDLDVDERAELELDVLWLAPADDVFLVRAMPTPDADVVLGVLRGECGGDGLDVYPYHAGGFGPRAYSFPGRAELFYTFVLRISGGVDELTLEVERPCKGTVGDCVTALDDALVCGVRRDLDYDTVCLPLHAPGEPSPLCPATTFEGEKVEGCCMPSGQCGHFSETLGCHDLAMEYWPWDLEFYCDERAAPDPPAYYECGWEPDPCEDDHDCCAHPNYGDGSCVDGYCVDAQG